MISTNSPVTHTKTNLIPNPKEGECEEPPASKHGCRSYSPQPTHHEFARGSCLLIGLGSSLMFAHLSLWFKFHTFLNRSKTVLILKTLFIYVTASFWLIAGATKECKIKAVLKDLIV